MGRPILIVAFISTLLAALLPYAAAYTQYLDQINFPCDFGQPTCIVVDDFKVLTKSSFLSRPQ